MLRIHGSARSRALRTLWITFELGNPVTSTTIFSLVPQARKRQNFWR